MAGAHLGLKMRARLGPSVLAAVAGLACSAVGPLASGVVHASNKPRATGLSVSGNAFFRDGRATVLRGVNRSGTEFACVKGQGIFDGPSDDASLEAIARWSANAVRIPLNEDCWLGLHGVAADLSGVAYREAISAYVDRVVAHGLTPILELHWSGDGDSLASGQSPMPDRRYAPAFWANVAATFRANDAVVFEPFNEPYPDYKRDTNAAWRCWRDGGRCAGVTFEAAGMQELVDAIRGAGATQVILLDGVAYANGMSEWRRYEPRDEVGELAAAWHVYDFNPCDDAACFETTIAPLARSLPLLATEIGQEACNHDRFVTPTMRWLDAHGVGYLAWTWDTWGNCPTLVSDYDGTPGNKYASAFRAHLIEIEH